MADLRNKVIGGFRIIDDLKLGSGSEGTVYKAVCETARFEGCPVGTVVALKTMMAQDDDHRLFAKLEKRTNELVRLDHPNVVRYFGCFFEQSGFAELHVVVQEFLEGETLKECLLTHPAGLDVDEAIKVIRSVIAGLSAAAERRIYHRDVKPGNIFMCADGAVKLIDFEVARQEGGTTSTGGAMVGTFDYMAPDFTDPSFRGDEMSDIFSAGVVMHEAITGRTPYQKLDGGNQQANFAFLSRWAKNEKGEYVTNPISISSKVRRLLSHGDEVLAAALSSDRSKRFARFSDFVLALGKIHFRELRNPGGGSAYQLLQIVGRGGFGEVFKARDRKSGRPVAIKHLLKQSYAERFRREAKVMTKLLDPCFVRFIEFFETPEAGAFIVMDYLDGMPGNSLRDAIRRAKGVGLDRKDVLSAFVRYAHGLALMHAGGKDKEPIYHRDIKPSNLYFPERRIDNAALMDFGIAKDMGGTMTVAGTVPGTLDYMPPEIVLMESRGDAGVDIYALGLCLYEALSGKMAYPRVQDDKSGTIAFMSRATKKLKPNFSDPSVNGNPEILALLTEMTDPDAPKRLANAREVELRIAKLAGVDPLPMEQDLDCAAQKAAERAVSQSEGEEDGETCATCVPPCEGKTRGTTALPVDGFQEALRRERLRLLVRRLLRFGLPFGLVSLAVIAYFAVPAVRNGVSDVVASITGKAVDNRADKIREAVEREYQTNLELAEQAAKDAIGKYEDTFLASTGSASRQAWIDKWSTILRPEDLLRLRRTIDTARDAREKRDEAKRKAYADRFETARKEAELVKGRYDGTDDLSVGDTARDDWQRKWQDKLEDGDYNAVLSDLKTARDARVKRDAPVPESAAEREYREKLGQAERAVRDVSGKYDDVFPMDVGDGSREAWLKQWNSALHADDLKRLVQEIDRSRGERIRRDAAKARRDEAKAYTNSLVTARTESAAVKVKFAADGQLSDADAALAVWKGKWEGKIQKRDWEPLLAEVAKARQARVQRDKEKAEEARVAQEKERRLKIEEIKKTVESFFQTEPLAERRKRLDECDKVLAAKETLELIDESERISYRNRVTAERLRVVGTVKNNTSLDFRVEGGNGTQYVPAKSAVTLDFPKGLQPGASLLSSGYEPIRLTRESLDGLTFVIAEDRPVPEAVAVTLPQLGEGVSCLVDGKSFVAGQKLHPGKHEYRYRRDDCVDQSGTISVEIAVPATLPAPAGWQDAPGLVKLGEAEAAEKKGGWDLVETLLAEADVVSPRNRKRKADLAGRLENHQEEERNRRKFERSLQEAKEYFSFSSWKDVLRTFAALKKAGYALTDEDRRMCNEARDKGTKEYNQRIEKLPYHQRNGPKEDKMRDELRQLNEWHREIMGE